MKNFVKSALIEEVQNGWIVTIHEVRLDAILTPREIRPPIARSHVFIDLYQATHFVTKQITSLQMADALDSQVEDPFYDNEPTPR